MGTRHVTFTADLPAPADAELGTYLRVLESGLPLPVAQRHRILAEAGDGLASSIQANLADGMAPGQAARKAIAEFGAPQVLARQFTAVIAPGIARRTGLGLILTGPLVGLAWAGVLGEDGGWASRISSLVHAVPYLIVLLAVTVPAAVLAAAGARIAMRHNLSTRLPVTAAWAATLGCLATDTMLLATAAIRDHGHAAMPVAVAVAFSGVRLAAAAIASQRLSRLRVAGY